MPTLRRAADWLVLRTLRRFQQIFDLESSGRLIFCSVIVGIVSGLGAALFLYLLETTQQLALGHIEGYFPPAAGTDTAAHAIQLPSRWWAVLAIPSLGGLLCGILVYQWAPEAEGHGTDAMVKSFHRLKGIIRGRVPIVKALASVITIGTGGSAGREGPIAQIGAGFGSFLGQKLHLSHRDCRLLVLAGAAGGIGAIFRAPLGGALFVGEVLYSTAAVEFEAFVPAVASSIIAYSVFVGVYGHGLEFKPASGLAFHGFHELPFYLVFAVVCALVGFVYVTTFYGLRNRFFRKLPLPRTLIPAVGGLLVGAMALVLPQVMAGGYGWIQLALDGRMSTGLLLALVFAKIAATSFTISSGGSGGVFAPSLFIGAMLGGAFGQTANQLFPGAIVQPEAFVLVGMGGFFAGVAKVPLTALIMVCEMSGSYELLVPLMLVSFVTVAILSSRWTLYEEQVRSLIDSPAHLGDFVVDVLERIHVRDVYQPDRPVDLVPQDLPMPKILSLVAGSRNSYFPVVDDHRKMVGIFSLRDVRSALLGNGTNQLVLAADLATDVVLTVTPEDDLHTALRRFTQKNIDDIPVVAAEDSKKVIGMLSRKEVIAAYDDQLARLRQGT
jgi:CIC family chloride channel protein